MDIKKLPRVSILEITRRPTLLSNHGMRAIIKRGKVVKILVDPEDIDGFEICMNCGDPTQNIIRFTHNGIREKIVICKACEKELILDET